MRQQNGVVRNAKRPYLLPYSPTQQNVEKFLRNGIIWVSKDTTNS
ncbi:hypothetical protein [Dapis sp. BLCC M172]